MLNHGECWILSIKTFVHFKCNIKIDLDFYARVRTCKKRVTGKQPLSPFSTRRICSRDVKRKQESGNVIGWRKSSLLRQPITLPDSCFRFASREQIRLVENGLYMQSHARKILWREAWV